MLSRRSESNVFCGDGGERSDFNVQSCAPEGALVDGIITVKWHGDNLCMDNVVDYFSKFGHCEPLDWSSVDGQNRVPLHFRENRAAAAVRSCLTYAVRDDRGRVIHVSIE